MRLRWPRFLPRFPALLLFPGFLALAAALTWIYRRNLAYGSVPLKEPSFGIPLTFQGWRAIWCDFHSQPHGLEYGFWLQSFLLDIALTLAAAYLLALGIDRLVFPLIRAIQGWRRGLRVGSLPLPVDAESGPQRHDDA